MSNEGVVIECGLLRVDFVWREDRFGHRILSRLPGSNEILESLEGRPDEKWPPSPALQSLHVEDRPDGARIAMLVGMAGRSHWSMSMETDAAQSRFLFDVACRVFEEPSRLGSSYAIARNEDGLYPVIQIEPAEPASLILADPKRATVIAAFAPSTLPLTIRWRYSVLLNDQSNR